MITVAQFSEKQLKALDILLTSMKQGTSYTALGHSWTYDQMDVEFIRKSLEAYCKDPEVKQ